MTKQQLFVYTKKEILLLIQDDINKIENQNHAVSFFEDDLPDMVKLKLSAWDKDEKSA